MNRFLKSLHQSLFLRLFLIFGGTVVFLSMIVSVSFGMISENMLANRDTAAFVKRQINVMMDDIGTPPDYEKVETLARQIHSSILIIGPDGRWQSDNVEIAPERMHKTMDLTEGASIVEHRRASGLRVTRGDYEYYFMRKHNLLTDEERAVLWAATIAGLGVLFLNYWLVRRLLQPIRQLKEGTERISHGELDYRVTHQRADELGDLTNSINQMADSLQAMLSAKQQLLLAVSHELRTPITRAKVQLEMLADPKVKQSLLEDINELDLLVSELLEAERLNSEHAALSIEELPLSRFVADTLTRYWPDHPLIQLVQPDQDQNVSIDRLRMSLLLRNLIGNALRYGSERPITVTVSFQPDTATLSIADEGQGIAAEHLPYLTDPFYRADTARQRQTGGFGLGLYLCRLIAEAHRGQLRLKSEPGEGTQVIVNIPI